MKSGTINTLASATNSSHLRGALATRRRGKPRSLVDAVTMNRLEAHEERTKTLPVCREDDEQAWKRGRR